MRLPLTSNILLCVVGLLALGQLVASYGEGCLSTQPCMGPGQTQVLGLSFQSDVLSHLLGSFLIAILASGIVGSVVYAARRDSMKALHIGTLVFCGVFLLSQLFAWGMGLSIVY